MGMMGPTSSKSPSMIVCSHGAVAALSLADTLGHEESISTTNDIVAEWSWQWTEHGRTSIHKQHFRENPKHVSLSVRKRPQRPIDIIHAVGEGYGQTAEEHSTSNIGDTRAVGQTPGVMIPG